MRLVCSASSFARSSKSNLFTASSSVTRSRTEICSTSISSWIKSIILSQWRDTASEAISCIVARLCCCSHVWWWWTESTIGSSRSTNFSDWRMSQVSTTRNVTSFCNNSCANMFNNLRWRSLFYHSNVGSSDTIIHSIPDALYLCFTVKISLNCLISIDKVFKFFLQTIVLIIQICHVFIKSIDFSL